MRRNSYLNQDLLREIRGRCEFGTTKIEEAVEKFNKPEPKAFEHPSHQMDDIAKYFEMRGYEFKALQDAAHKEMLNNPMLLKAYRQFIMIAKLTCVDAVEKVRQHERRQHDEKAAREGSYRNALAAYEARKKRLEDNWSSIRSTIRTRWNKLIRSMATLLEANASLDTIAERDVVFLRILESRGWAEISDRVEKMSWEFLLEDITIEEINDVIIELETKTAPEGSWKPRTKVDKLDQISA